jgi:glycosyltransferase involved in cell wall biosynthesis
MKVSVITTVYNCEKFIEESINSILAQTYDDFELIIIDDGSTDNTVDVIRSFNDKRITWIAFDHNLGIPSRANFAIDFAKGEYIAIHDADDISLPTRLEQEVKMLNSDKSLFCVGGYAIIINEDGLRMKEWNHPPNSNSGMINIIASGKNPIINPSAMFKRDDFNKIGKYTTEKDIQLVHDLEFWGRCLFSGLNFCTLETPLVKYRINKNGLTFGRSSEMRTSHQMLLKRWREKGLI